jgi:hypothetical protein
MHRKFCIFQKIAFSAGFLPLLSENDGHTDAEFSRPITFLRPVLSYFAEFAESSKRCLAFNPNPQG